MMFKSEPLTIVRTEPGKGTAETIYIASDGSRWTNESNAFVTHGGTGAPQRGRIVGNKIFR